MVNVLPSVYDAEKGEWVTLLAKPIAEEVLKIMKADYLEHKGNIGFFISKYKDGDSSIEQPNVVVFYNEKDYDTMELTESELTNALNEYIDYTLDGKYKPFSLNNFINYLEDYGYRLPVNFEVDVTIILSDGQKFTYPRTSSITNNASIVDALKSEDQYIEVKYIYNDHAIDDKKLAHGNDTLK
ncbi:hypothetical protein QCF18_09960 [Staphylococcus aureus]|nr:hypothetical protein [Staphylococcus aureus]YP_009098166.1 hypothetical protein QLX38_gp032 [Staphylococcus phage Team1]YP_009224442.1 hypothetical protein ST812_032 [Staphylococcus phage 812]YP_009780354.1 hypothetical protein QLX37_gp081 [Staphylococcus phage SA5]YP_009782264.1 hypothetical protein QLX43_gp043 [Staphylococcus phage IME-SA1]YP_009782543.1 hypothetical protein QLX45_gp042 [Staphylococcus phage IME-SA118]AVZ44503.1 hypothetical protein [Staphylococcus phage HYZ21]AZB49959.